jgi:tRNA1(Val) A37 N6-methylase TrmN6
MGFPQVHKAGDSLFDPEFKTIETLPHRQTRSIQNKTGYRYSADACLLAQFIEENEKTRKPLPKEFLELGAGSGVISLMLAASFPQAGFKAVEAQESLFQLAAPGEIWE